MSGTLAYALKAAAPGLLVFPLDAGTKREKHKGHPLDRSHATTDPDAICAMWADAGEYANIGIIVPPGCVAVDRDAKDAADFKHDLGNTRTDHTQGNGLRAFYTLPPGLECPSYINRGPGRPFETFGPKGRVVGAGSRTRKGEYTCINEAPFAPAPAWLVDAIEAYNATQKAKRTAAAERLATMSIGTPPPPDGIQKRYAEAVLVNAVDELSKITDTPGQGRTTTLLNAALRVGSHLHLGLDAGAAAGKLAEACEHWRTRNRNADLKAIEKGMTKGAESPNTPAWKAISREINQANVVMARYVATAKAGGKVGTPGRTVRATTANATLGAMVGHTCKYGLAGAFIMSVRDIAEAIGTSHPTVIRALDALRAEGILHRVDRKEAAYIRAYDADGVKLHDKQLAAAYTFDAITVLALLRIDTSNRLSGESEALPLDNPNTGINLQHRHIFSRAGLGRSAGAVVNAIAQGARTPGQIVTVTGLHKSTVSRTLDRLRAYRFVIVDDAQLSLAGAAELAAAADVVHLDKGLAGRQAARLKRHDQDRDKQHRWLAWREAEKAAGNDYSYATWKALQKPAQVPPEPVDEGLEIELPAFITSLVKATIKRLPPVDTPQITALFTGHYMPKPIYRAELQGQTVLVTV